MCVKRGWFCKVLCLLGSLFFLRPQSLLGKRYIGTLYLLEMLCAIALCIISVQNNKIAVFWGFFCYAKPCRVLSHGKSCSFKLPALCSPQVTSSTPAWLPLIALWLVLPGRWGSLNAWKCQNVSRSHTILIRTRISLLTGENICSVNTFNLNGDFTRGPYLENTVH